MVLRSGRCTSAGFPRYAPESTAFAIVAPMLLSFACRAWLNFDTFTSRGALICFASLWQPLQMAGFGRRLSDACVLFRAPAWHTLHVSFCCRWMRCEKGAEDSNPGSHQEQPAYFL